MPRLYRPHIPLEVQARVLVRQIGYLWPDEVLKGVIARKELAHFVKFQKSILADALGCAAVDLRLDHDPALATRQRKGEGKETVYFPDANDPEFLIYREKTAHDVKTRIRGEHGQYSDIVLIKRERKRKQYLQHGDAIRGQVTREYRAWQEMIRRCERPERRNGYAVEPKICARWRNSFQNFLADMGRKPSAKHSIDRYPNNNGNYEPGNCRWATAFQQARNTSRNLLVEYRGLKMALSEAASMAGLRYGLVKRRLQMKWSVERALSMPAMPSGRPKTEKTKMTKVIGARELALRAMREDAARPTKRSPPPELPKTSGIKPVKRKKKR